MAAAERGNDEAPNSAPLGAMGYLLSRLDTLSCNDDGGSISELKGYIREISDKLKELSEAQDPPLTVNYWMNHARELSYDIEAYLDDLDAQTEDNLNDSDAKKEDHPDDSDAKPVDSVEGSDDKMEDSSDDSDMMMEDSINDSDDETKDSVDDSDSSIPDSICSSDYKISGFRTRAKGMIDRYESFSLGSILSCPPAATTIVSPRPSRHVVLVGMGDQIRKLISLLDAKKENGTQLKIVSILGDEGIGKSTLVQEIWRESFKEEKIWPESQLNVERAFVRMGKHPDVRMILRSILSQVSQQGQAKHSEVTNLIRDIKTHLKNKRYFIIVDDVPSVSVWDVVSRAFPRCGVGSRIITTTSDKEVALACCSYVVANKYNMNPLGVDECEELFIGAVGFGTVNLQLSNQVSVEIQRKCGGLPLAIIWAANLVASQLETKEGLSRSEKEQNQLDSVAMKFVDENLRSGSTAVEILNQVLKLCYNSLPHYLKTCLLYLSVYPENYFFLKEDLVKLWIAEGFITTSEEDKVEAAGRYFDVLVSLGLIWRMDINCNKQHHQGQGEVVEDKEEYLLRVPYVLHPTVFDFITSKSAEDNFITVVDYSQLTVAFKEKIRRLSLHFGSATYASTPESIGLSHVRTLSFMGLLSCMPSLVEFNIVRVVILHLWVDNGDKKFSLEKICRLLLLRYLQVRCNVTVELPGQIGCLKHLETLEINSVVTTLGPVSDHRFELLPLMDGSSSTSTPSVQIFELLLPICIFSRMPKWIPQLHKLSILEIVVRELLTTDIDMLADLPALTALSLYVRIPTARNIVFRRGAFPALKYFRFMCGVLSLEFQEEAVPNLQRLNIGFNVNTTGHKYDSILVGIQHLSKIQEVVAIIGASTGAVGPDRIEAESALKDAITNKHPRPPMFNVKRVHLIEQDEVPVRIYGYQTEGWTTEQDINLVTAKDRHEHADSSFANVLWNTNMGDRNVDHNLLEDILAGSERPRHIPLEILTSITDNFSEDRRIGSGRFSDVYKGVLHDWIVAVKKITVNTNNIDGDDKLFHREVQSLLKIIEHPNVVRFLGFCSNTYLEVQESTGAEKRRLVEIRERLLCFEYISKGSLKSYITDELRGLEWNTRYQIIKGICEGLQCLHNKMAIIHMDLKPANILVDADMVPKITDFGIARLVENKYTMGDRFFSLGYCAPEYIINGKTTVECDIYSLGVVIKEIVAGRKEIPNEEHVIRRWRCRWKKSATYTPVQVQEITKCIEIAERCTHEQPEKRPSISDIICDLDESANTDVNLSAVTQQIPSCDYDDILGIDPLELRFNFELLNKEISKEVVLTNETDNCIAFNIKTSTQLLYRTQPNKGIVRPGSKIIVNITLQVHGTTTLGFMPCADEFIVQSTKVVDGLTDDEITEDIFNEDAGTVVDVVNLTVVYEKLQADEAIEANTSVSKEATACSSSKDVRLINFRPIETTSATSQYKASERAAVDIMTGAMGGLLPKLGKLLKGEYNLPEDLEEEVESLEEQLTDMHTALCNVPHEEMHMLDLQDKKWANKVKNLSYDIEDMVDGLLISFKGSEPITNLDGFQTLVQKMLKLVRNVADRSKEVKLTLPVANRPVSTDVEARILDWYNDNPVGIDGPRDWLVEKLTGGDDHASKQKLKIISIFGEGGLGKTTLVKNVFDKLASKFILKAFVPVGRNPDIKRVLEDILFKLDTNGNKDIHNSKKDVRQLIDGLRNLLGNKRYFIVIDDIWDIESWEIVKCALIENDNGSRVMTTSRIHAVAKISGEALELKPLSHDQSKELFYRRFTHKSTRTFDKPDEQSTENVIKKCGGLPLAIITIASLLDGKRVVDWPKVYNSIKFGHEDNRAQNTKKILMFSYLDLPCHLKTCLLYLSTYREDEKIEKNTLVWKWIAEGFVRQEKGKTLFEVGEGYFYELINRSIIQPAELLAGTLRACHVHDMVHDLICSIAKEDNFVTILDNDDKHLSSQNNARILAVHKGVLEQRVMFNTCKQVMRSFIVSRGCDLTRMELDSLFPSFPVLRVLSLEECEAVSGDHAYRLKYIAQLCHLTYLSLAGTKIRELPMEIGDLKRLQILNLTETGIKALPQSVTLLRELKCLLCCCFAQPVKLPYGMGSLTSLEDLCLSLDCGFEEDISSGDDSSDLDVEEQNWAVANFVEELGKLAELRVLHIRTYGFRDILEGALMESLNKLKKMEKLMVCEDIFDGTILFDRWSDYSPCEKPLRHLTLSSTKMPEWINASLGSIICMDLRLLSLTAKDLSDLGSLPELRSLDLQCDDVILDVAVAADAFPKLRYFTTNCFLTYVPKAMQCLESLSLTLGYEDDFEFDFDDFEFDFDSLHCLRSLEKVIIISCDWMKTEKLVAALRRAIDNHPSCPILEIEG